jgi:light-regulated signal transduction histidine kinase (bacteriophytochrome)
VTQQFDSVQEMQSEFVDREPANLGACIQPCGYLLELSLDWIVLRASENIHHLLGESHVTLVDEPLGRFVHAQALHDLRNLFSRLSGTTGIARAYRVRLTDEPELVDIAFQLSGGRVILEAVPSAGEGFGEAFGTVAGLIAGLASNSGQALLDSGARRMRALTGYDRVTLVCGDRRAQSSRAAFGDSALPAAPPAIIADADAHAVAVFPRSEETSIDAALMRAPDGRVADRLSAAGVPACMSIRFALEDGTAAEFRCENRNVRQPSFELHAAAELFAQLFAMRLAIDDLRRG